MAKKKKTTVKKAKTPRFQGFKSFLKNRQTQTVFGFFTVNFIESPENSRPQPQLATLKHLVASVL